MNLHASGKAARHEWRGVVCWLVFTLACTKVFGQHSIEFSGAAEKLFNRGIADYVDGSYAEASLLFDRLLREYPACHRVTAAYVMKGKALLLAGDPDGARRNFQKFLDAYPVSAYVPDAHYSLGLTYLAFRQYAAALTQFVAASRSLPGARGNEKLRRDIMQALDTTSVYFASVSDLETFRRGAADDTERAFFTLALAEKYASVGDKLRAASLLDSLTLRHPPPSYQERLVMLRQRLDQPTMVKIGILVPLMRKTGERTPMREIAESVLEGMRFAFEEYQQGVPGRPHVELEVRDTERDTALIVKLTSQLGDDQSVICVLGPVFSNAAWSAARVAEAKGLPLVSPTANANGIASIGVHVFQANPDFRVRGKAMARYAVVNRGFTKLAVLAPKEGNGSLLADAFVAEAHRLGANILARESYARDEGSLTGQLTNIRMAAMRESAEPYLSFAGKMSRRDIERLMRLGVSAKLLDSLTQGKLTISAKLLLGPSAKRILDSLKIATVAEDAQSRLLEVPVTALDAMYIPIRGPEEIGVVSPQLAYMNIKTQIVGSGEWNDPGQLSANALYCDGVLFDADSYIDEDNASCMEFLNRYQESYNKKPSRHVLYGYDAARLVLTQLRNGVVTREGLRQSLSNLTEFPGIRSKISFKNGRVNSWVHVLQYRGDTVGRVGEVDVGGTVR